jgi:hypothetical protein
MTVKEHNGKEGAGLIGSGEGRVAGCCDNGVCKIGQVFNQLRNYYRLKNDPTAWLGSGAEVQSVTSYAYVFLTV